MNLVVRLVYYDDLIITFEPKQTWGCILKNYLGLNIDIYLVHFTKLTKQLNSYLNKNLVIYFFFAETLNKIFKNL